MGRYFLIIIEPRHEISNNVLCATSKASDQPVHMHSLIGAFASRLYILWLKLLTYHRLEFLSLKGGCTESCESTVVKMPHCWKSHVTAHIFHYGHIVYYMSQHMRTWYLSHMQGTQIYNQATTKLAFQSYETHKNKLPIIYSWQSITVIQVHAKLHWNIKK